MTLALFWAFMAISPVLILTHTEYHSAGTSPGWHSATLAADGVLYAWTRNRLVAWLALYLFGAAMLSVGSRRDPSGERLRVFAASNACLCATPFCLLLLLSLLAVAGPPDALLVSMAVADVFFALRVMRGSGAALARSVGHCTAFAATLLLASVLAEAVLRLPAVAARTGGSMQARAAMRDAWDRQIHPDNHGLRWRSRHLSEPKPEGATRVFVLGDSFSYGDFIANTDELWPNVLEDALRAQGCPVQVINSGQSGADTSEELQILDQLGWSYAPDVVVLQFTLNDVGDDPMNKAIPLLPIIGSSLRVKSHLYHFLDVQFAALQTRLFRPEGWSTLYTDESPGWRRSQESVRHVVDAAKAHGVPVVMLLYPMLDSDLRDTGYRNLRAHQAIAAFASGLGIGFVDIRGRLAEIDWQPQSWWVRPFDAHPNVAAHRVAGEAMAVVLKPYCATPRSR